MHGPDFTIPFTDPILVFGTAMIIFLVVPLILGRYRIPGIIGLIIVGAIIGPNALHVLQRGETIQLLGQVGLVYLMFVAGLEINLNQFFENKDRSITFGLFSFLIPQVLGTAVGVGLLGFSLPAALLFASIFSSHTLLAYPVVNRLGIAKNNAVTATIGGTILTDTLALLVLAVVLAADTGDIGAGFWMRLAIGLALLFIGIWMLVPRLGRWFFRNLDEESYFDFLFVMAVLFICAYLAEVAGVEAIIGAFLAGLVLNRLIPETGVLMNRIEFVGNALFIPFFLLSVGMLVDASVIFEGPDTLVVAAALIVMVFATKYVAAWTTGKIYSYSPSEMMNMFGLSIGQAAAALAIVLIGFDAGLFGESVVNATVLMILATAIVSPWLVEKHGREIALQEAERPYEPSEAPQRILVPLANPETSEDLMDLALVLRHPDSDEPVYPLTIARAGDNTAAGVAAAEELLSGAVVHASAAEKPVRAITRVDLNVASGIKRAVQEERISTVVIGWSGDTLAREYIFGSVLDQLLDRTQEMIFVCKISRPLNTMERVVVAIPPYFEREAGFGDSIRALKVMTEQLGLELLVVTTTKAEPGLMPIIEKTRPDVPVEVLAIDTWGQLLQAMREEVGPNDLLVLMSVREGAVAWRAALDRLPRLIAQRFTENNFLTLYMPELSVLALTQQENLAERKQLLLEHFTPEHVTLDIRQEAFDDIVREILGKSGQFAPGKVNEICRLLRKSDESYAPELMPGVMLLHAHTQLVDEKQLFVGISKRGVSMPRASGPVHVLLLVLIPMGIRTEDYLDRVAAAADIVHKQDMVNKLRACQTPEDAYELLKGSLSPTSVD